MVQYMLIRRAAASSAMVGGSGGSPFSGGRVSVMIEPKWRYQSSRLTSAETQISRSAAHWDRAADASLMENSSLAEP